MGKSASKPVNTRACESGQGSSFLLNAAFHIVLFSVY